MKHGAARPRQSQLPSPPSTRSHLLQRVALSDELGALRLERRDAAGHACRSRPVSLQRGVAFGAQRLIGRSQLYLCGLRRSQHSCNVIVALARSLQIACERRHLLLRVMQRALQLKAAQLRSGRGAGSGLAGSLGEGSRQ